MSSKFIAPPLRSNNANRALCTVALALIDIGLNVCIQNGLLCKLPSVIRLFLYNFHIAIFWCHAYIHKIVSHQTIFDSELSSFFLQVESNRQNILLSIKRRLCLDGISHGISKALMSWETL